MHICGQLIPMIATVDAMKNREESMQGTSKIMLHVHTI